MESIGQYTAKTFFMDGAFIVTFGIACWAGSPMPHSTPWPMWPYIHLIVLIATIVLSITMVSALKKMSVGTARGIFIAFSALFGFTMSMYLIIFEFGSLDFSYSGHCGLFHGAGCLRLFYQGRPDPAAPHPFTGLVFLFVFALVSLFIPGFTALTGSSAWRASPSSWAILPMIPRRSKPTTTTMRATPTCWRRRLFSPPFSCTWISSTCFCTCCAFWASPGIERAAEQRKRGPVSQTGPLFHFVHR